MPYPKAFNTQALPATHNTIPLCKLVEKCPFIYYVMMQQRTPLIKFPQTPWTILEKIGFSAIHPLQLREATFDEEEVTRQVICNQANGPPLSNQCAGSQATGVE